MADLAGVLEAVLLVVVAVLEVAVKGSEEVVEPSVATTAIGEDEAVG